MTAHLARVDADRPATARGVRRSEGAPGELAVVRADRFMVSDPLGDALAGSSHGFYAFDTRFLSTYVLRVNGERALPLTARNLDHDAASFYATNAAGDDLEPGAISILRDRRVDGALHDELLLTNHAGRPVTLDLTLELDADFLDVFEVRRLTAHRPAATTESSDADGRVVFVCRHDGLVQRTSVSFSAPPRLSGSTASFEVHLRPREEWRLAVEIRVGQHDQAGERTAPLAPPVNGSRGRAHAAESARAWTVPALSTDDPDLRAAFQRGVDDLRALEMTTPDGHVLPAAGLPWYVAVFGRDALITAYETLLLGPELAVGTLHALAAYQATERDDFRDAEPGKMPHEVRNGRLARLGIVPHARYYGTVDATPLWLVLLGETYRWTGDLELVRDLLPAAEAALAWIDAYGDLDGDGFVEYLKRSPEGLDNQGWKDSWDGVRFADGRVAKGPIALVEVQGYVYRARLLAAELFEALGQRARAQEQRARASRLKEAFDQAFWMPEHGYYALALDGRKHQVDSITSNAGQALWTGIVAEHRAAQVAERLLADDLFSGWGIRTVSTQMGGYNPVSYHNGSVWPHDTALIAAGLARYGFGAAASRVLRGLLDAAAGFPRHRLPELFSGHARRPGGFPVEYPAANAPQAWAAGSVVLALQTLLGVAPGEAELQVRPLPGAPASRLAGVAYRGRRFTVERR